MGKETVSSIADLIGVDGYEVLEFLELSEQKHALYHGVKQKSRLPGIEEYGVKPLAPESRASHWTTGLRTFVNREGRFREGSMATYDTPFFHYANAAMAITDEETLRSNGIRIQWSDHNEITIPVIIPRSAITIVTTIVATVDGIIMDGMSPREYRRLEEKLMFGALLDHLHHYSVGKTILPSSIPRIY